MFIYFYIINTFTNKGLSMALYYWAGTTSSDMNVAANWTTWGSIGATGPIPAARKPFWGDDVYFKLLGTTGGVVWPIFGPSGTLTGTGGTAGSPGGTGETFGTRYLRSAYVQADFPRPLGSSTGYLNIYADQISIFKNSNPTPQAHYVNALSHPAGNTLPNISIGNSYAGMCFYIKGVGNINSSQNVAWSGNIYLYNFDGSLKQDNIASAENYYFDTTTSLSGDHTFKGRNVKVYIEKGFALQSDGIMTLDASPANSTLSLYMQPLGITGVSGPANITYSTLKLKTISTNSDYPYIQANHGAYFMDLDMNGGHLYIDTSSPSEPVVILEGTMVASNSRMTISDSAKASILAPSGGYDGFAIENVNSGVLPIIYSGNYLVSLTDTNISWPGNP